MATVIFDLDGTLVDSAPDIHRAGNAAAARFEAAPVDLPTARGFVGRGARIYVQRLIEATGLDAGLEEALFRAFLEEYAGAVALSALYPGVTAALDSLATQGHTLGLCTNKPEAAIGAVLDAFDLTHRFGTVVGGDTLATGKPDPAPLYETMARLGAATCLYVGDSDVDAETAARAGCPFILYLHGYRSADPQTLSPVATFGHYERLPEIIASLCE